MFLFRRPASSPPGPPRFFLYLEAALLLLLSLSLLSSYTKRYPLFNQADSSLYELKEDQGENAGKEPSKMPSESKPKISDSAENTQEKKFIRWVDFTITADALDKAFRFDLDTCLSTPHLNWIELLAYLGARYGGDFSRYKASDMDSLAEKLLQGESMENLTKEMKYYPYYLEAYTAVLGGMVGPFREEIPAEQAPESGNTGNTQGAENGLDAENMSDAENSPDTQNTQDTVWVTKYGLKAFSPIASGFLIRILMILAQQEVTALNGSI